jgi:hypothetical protein
VCACSVRCGSSAVCRAARWECRSASGSGRRSTPLDTIGRPRGPPIRFLAKEARALSTGRSRR